MHILSVSKRRFCAETRAAVPKVDVKHAESKVAKQVNMLKTNVGEEAASVSAHGHGIPANIKPSLWQRVKDELMHYYSGTKLLALETKISSKLLLRFGHHKE